MAHTAYLTPPVEPSQESQPSTAAAMPKVVLVGPPGAGKTTIGRRLSSALNLPLVDSDELISQDQGQPCGQVYAQLGETAFRELEERMVAQALASEGIVSLGGGAVLSAQTRAALAEHTVVWVTVSVAEGVRRTHSDDSRPVLQGDDPAQRYSELLAQREEFYREVSDFRTRTDGRSPQQVVGEILSFLDNL